MIEVVDSGQLLVLPPEAAKEVQLMFQYMMQDVQDTFYSPMLLALDVSTVDLHSGQGSQQRRALLGPEALRKASTYAYQHLFLPVVRLVSTVLQGAAAHCDVTSTSRDTATLHSMANYLLNFLVDNDMYQTAMYIMSQLPFSPEEAMGSRRQLQDTLQGSSHRVSLLPQSLQQQLLTLHIAQQHTAESLQELRQRSRVLPILDLQEQQFDSSDAAMQPAAATTVRLQSFDESVASADDILRQLGELEQARLEQEALEHELLSSQQHNEAQQDQQLAAGPTFSYPATEPAVLPAPGHLQRCNSVPWSFHSQQQSPYRTLAPPTSVLPDSQQYFGSGSSDGQGLFLDTAQFNSLGFKQAQPSQRQSRASSEEVEGYLQPHRCLLRRSIPAAASDMRQPAASTAQQAAVTRPASAGLSGGGVFLPDQPVGQTTASSSTQVDVQPQQQQSEPCNQPLTTVGSAVAAANEQRLHLQLQLEEVDVSLTPAPAPAPAVVMQPKLVTQRSALPYAASLQHAALPIPAAGQQQLPLAAHASRQQSAGMCHPAVAIPAAAAADTPVVAAQMLPAMFREAPGRQLALLQKQPILQPLDCIYSKFQQDLSGTAPVADAQTQWYDEQGSAASDEWTVSKAAAAAYGGNIAHVASDVASSSSKVQQDDTADVYQVQSVAVWRSTSSAKQQAVSHIGVEHSEQACCGASCSSSAAQTVDAATTSGKALQGSNVNVYNLQSLTGAAISGFKDSHMEQSYVMFKNHSSGLVDATAAVLCLGMLIASANRSLLLQESQSAEKLVTMAVYGLAFFFPYGVMQVKPQLYLRFRESMLVWARVLSSIVLVVVGLGLAPMPDAWAAGVFKSCALHLQDGFILPCCQQVRLRAAAVIVAAQCIADAALLRLGYTPWYAVLQSIGLGVCALLVGVWLDVWCRKQFMVRYKGLFRGN